MRKHVSWGFIAIVATLPLAAFSSTSDPLALAPGSRLWVDGTSTVRDFQCKAVALGATIEAADAAVPAVLAGEKGIRTVRFDVPVDRMDCANGTMNGHMLKALKAKEHPVISFRLQSYELTRAADQARGLLTGTLEIGGVEKPLTLSVDLLDAGDGGLRVTGSHELNMRDFNLEPPSLMLGTLKVRERVKVSFDLLLKY